MASGSSGGGGGKRGGGSGRGGSARSRRDSGKTPKLTQRGSAASIYDSEIPF